MQVRLNHLQRGSNKKRFQCCLDSDGHILLLRAIQRHSGRDGVDLPLQDNVEIPYAWMEHIDPVGSSVSCNSVIQCGLIAGGKHWKEGRQTVFSRALDLMSEPQRNELYDVYIVSGKCTRKQFIGTTCRVLRTGDW